MANIFDGLKTPNDIFKFVKNNIKYDSTTTNWRLRTPQDTFKSKKGNCHDQAHFISAALKNIGISNSLLFFIEYNEHESAGGRTHTLVHYKENNKIYWMETSWGGFKKIHGPFNSTIELKSYIEHIHFSFHLKLKIMPLKA